jgi:hypothetical protein
LFEGLHLTYYTIIITGYIFLKWYICFQLTATIFSYAKFCCVFSIISLFEIESKFQSSLLSHVWHSALIPQWHVGHPKHLPSWVLCHEATCDPL